jgi:uncharacterized protein
MSDKTAIISGFALLFAALFQTACGSECAGGGAKGCIERGEENAFNSGLSENHAKAFALFREACDAGAEKGCDDLLWMCLESKCTPEEAAKVAQVFQAACDASRAKRCTGLGVLNARGIGVQEDDEKAEMLFQKGCDGGDARGCEHLAARYASRSLGEVLVCGHASALMRMLIEPFELRLSYVLPHENSCQRVIIERVVHRQIPSSSCSGCSFVLGTRYATGTDIRDDDVKAAQLYQRACDGGDGLGCLNLSYVYRNGPSGRKDTAKAEQVATKGFSLIKNADSVY